MRRGAVLFALLALVGVGRSRGAEEKVLNVFTWPDYIAPDTIASFEKEYGIKVNYDTYDSTEMAEARLLAGRTGYDVVDHAERYSDWCLSAARQVAAQQLGQPRSLGAQVAGCLGSRQPLRCAVPVGHDWLHLQRAHDQGAHARCAGDQR
jgi:hypothetical protein